MLSPKYIDENRLQLMKDLNLVDVINTCAACHFIEIDEDSYRNKKYYATMMCCRKFSKDSGYPNKLNISEEWSNRKIHYLCPMRGALVEYLNNDGEKRWKYWGDENIKQK